MLFQMETTFLVQGLHMRLDFGSQSQNGSVQLNDTEHNHHKDFKVTHTTTRGVTTAQLLNTSIMSLRLVCMTKEIICPINRKEWLLVKRN